MPQATPETGSLQSLKSNKNQHKKSTQNLNPRVHVMLKSYYTISYAYFVKTGPFS